MKKYVMLIVLVVLAIADMTATETSRITEFISQRGVLIVKEFHEIGTANGKLGTKLKFTVLKLTDTSDMSIMRGLKIEASSTGRYGDDVSTAFLDVEEVESLVSALRYMLSVKQQIGDIRDYPYTEYTFNAKESFSIGFYISENRYSGYAKAGSVSPTSVFFEYDSLQSILTQIEACRSKIAQL